MVSVYTALWVLLDSHEFITELSILPPLIIPQYIQFVVWLQLFFVYSNQLENYDNIVVNWFIFDRAS
mgnify:CR=1 FL=1